MFGGWEWHHRLLPHYRSQAPPSPPATSPVSIAAAAATPSAGTENPAEPVGLKSWEPDLEIELVANHAVGRDELIECHYFSSDEDNRTDESAAGDAASARHRHRSTRNDRYSNNNNINNNDNKNNDNKNNDNNSDVPIQLSVVPVASFFLLDLLQACEDEAAAAAAPGGSHQRVLHWPSSEETTTMELGSSRKLNFHSRQDHRLYPHDGEPRSYLNAPQFFGTSSPSESSQDTARPRHQVLAAEVDSEDELRADPDTGSEVSSPPSVVPYAPSPPVGSLVHDSGSHNTTEGEYEYEDDDDDDSDSDSNDDSDLSDDNTSRELDDKSENSDPTQELFGSALTAAATAAAAKARMVSATHRTSPVSRRASQQRPHDLLPSQKRRRYPPTSPGASSSAAPPPANVSDAAEAADTTSPVGPPAVHFNEAQIASDSVRAARTAKRADAAMREGQAHAAGRITPGVDDTPYIQYALEALTRRDSEDAGGDPRPPYTVPPAARKAGYRPRQGHAADAISNIGLDPIAVPVALPCPGHPRGYLGLNKEDRIRKLFRQDTASTESPSQRANFARPAPAPPSRARSSRNTSRDRLICVSESELNAADPARTKHPPLNRKPRLLQTGWIMFFVFLCALVIAGLITAVVYASRPTGLTRYSGTINSGQYFVFRVMPQMIAALLLVFAQHITVSSFRVAPFARMAEEDATARFGALFQDMYPRSFLWPHLVGPWQLKVGTLSAWLLMLTVPLTSSLFNVVYVEGEWYWATVQGIAWVLVVVYFAAIAGLVVLLTYWHGRTTGLMWDPRCLADLIPMLTHLPPSEDYLRSEGLATRKQLMTLLNHGFVDRLGYWARAGPNQPIFYGIGKPWSVRNVRRTAFGTILDKKVNLPRTLKTTELRQPTNTRDVRYRHLPRSMRTNQASIFAVAGVILLVALLIVSFADHGRLSQGFTPGVPAAPNAQAFSSANFTFSFVPALLGTLMLLALQSLDLKLRIRKPWAELGFRGGKRATKTLLLDYAACTPFEAALKAASNNHWRVAYVSMATSLSVFIPVLAGGAFMALTIDATGEVRMFPQVGIYGVLVALLVLYVVALLMFCIWMDQFALPHPVDCPAEIISFCACPTLLQDPAFADIRTRADLLGRLGGGLGKEKQSKWVFECLHGSGRLGVRRVAYESKAESMV